MTPQTDPPTPFDASEPTTSNSALNWHTMSDEEILDIDLVVALNMETASDEEKVAFVAKTAQTVQKAVALRVLDNLSPEKRDELTAMLTEPDVAVIDSFLSQNVPNFADIIQQETIALKRAILTGEIPARYS